MTGQSRLCLTEESRRNMAKTGPEYAIFFAILGVLTAIGIPAIRRGEVVLGWLCIVVAGAVLIWGGLSIWRARH